MWGQYLSHCCILMSIGDGGFMGWQVLWRSFQGQLSHCCILMKLVSRDATMEYFFSCDLEITFKKLSSHKTNIPNFQQYISMDNIVIVFTWPWNDIQNNCHQMLPLPTNSYIYLSICNNGLVIFLVWPWNYLQKSCHPMKPL